MPSGIPAQPRGRQLARDLVLDIHNRIITTYDAITILKMMEPQDSFGFIVARRLLPNLTVEYELQEMDIAPDLGDPELNRVADIYRTSDAVMVKDSATVLLAKI